MPARIEVEAGKTYFWCSCGLSANQPFCDGAHAGTDFKPVAFTPENDGLFPFCTCKRAERDGGVRCDGAHNRLPPEE